MNFHYTIGVLLQLICCLIQPANAQTTQATVTSIIPYNSSVYDTVVVTGKGFDATNPFNNILYFNNQVYVSPGVFEYDSIPATVIAVTDSTLTVITPLGAVYGNISAKINGVTAISEDIYFSIIPTITGFNPDQGSVGDTIIITGTGFDWRQPSGNLVQFTAGNLTWPITVTQTSLKVVVPIGSITGPVKVRNGISPFNFTVNPTVEYLYPASGQVSTTVWIYGTGFDAQQPERYQVTFNGLLAEIVFITHYLIEVKVPHRASSGPVIVTFNEKVLDGSGQYFEVIPTAPQIYSYDIYSGSIGTPVIIIGNAFDQSGPALSVSFGEVMAPVLRYTNDTIFTKVPRGALSSQIQVTAGGLTENGPYFKVIERLDSVSNQSAHVGDTLTIYGLGFNYVTEDFYRIAFPASNASTPIINAADSTLTFVVPYNATSGSPFIYSDYDLSLTIPLPHIGIIPVIQTLTPDTIITGRKQTVTITGTGFGRSSMTTEYKLIFSENIEQTNIASNGYTSEPGNGYVQIWTPVPNSAQSGYVTLVIDGLSALSPYPLVVLPDTFPYQPDPPDITITAVTSTSFSCNWVRPYRAIGFLVDISTDNFQTFLEEYTTAHTADTILNVTGLQEGTTYQLRIRSYSDTDTSLYSFTKIITTVPPKPVALEPILFSELEYLIQWTPAKGATGYIIDLSIDNFSTFESILLTETALHIFILDKRLSFFAFRVRAFNESGISEYSNSITVVITDTEDIPASINLYPNPSQDFIKLEGLNTPIYEAFIVENSGKIIPTQLINTSANNYILDVRTLTPGVYVLKILTGQSVINLRFIKS